MKRGPVATILVIAVLAVALLLVYGGVLGGAQPSPPATSIPPSAQQTTPATGPPSASPIDTAVVALALVVPQRSAELALPISGVVDQVFVREGDLVTVNQLLLKLDQQTYLAQIDVSEADVRRANLALERAQLLVEQLPSDASPGQVDSAQAELRLAEAELELARASLTDAQAALRQTDIRAPFAGTVAEVTVGVGEQALAGQPAVTIGDMSGWLIETTDLSELEVVRIAVGDRATVAFHALPDLELVGTVDRIQVRGTTADGDVLFAVVIKPDVHHTQLRWNMTVTVRITPTG